MTRAGHTLVECITVVLILSALAFIAVPRLSWGAVSVAQTDAAVRQLATDLRRTRMYAIAHAADNPTGYALVMSDSGYQIVDLHDSAIVASDDMPAQVRCTGRRSFEFGPLGNLTEGSDSWVRVHSTSRAYRLEIVPATGAVKWQREK